MTDLTTRTRAARIAVAERKGWRDIHATGGLPCGLAPGTKDPEGHEALPDYPTDPRAYMPLLEEIAADGHNNPEIRYWRKAEKWSVNPTGWAWEPKTRRAPTLGLAVCEAWLAWDESNQQEQDHAND